MDQSSERVPHLPPAYRLVALDSVGSTNEEARRLAREGAEDGTLVWAREQTAGRGRQGRGWSSPRGNLYLSIVLRPDCAPREAAQLSFVAAVALADAIGSVAPPLIEVRFKWPNDVLLNDRKAAGILLEAELTPEGGLDWMVLGCGVNVASYPKPEETGESALPATSLRFEGAPTSLTEVELLEAFGRHLLTWVNRWLDDGFAPVRKRWLAHAKGLGEPVTVRLPRATLEGRFADMDEEGALVLELPDGKTRRIAAGDLYFG